MMIWHVLACTTAVLPVPALDRVVPGRGWNGEATVVAIEGEAFYPQVEMSANQADGADLDRGFVAWLDGDPGRFALSSVSAVDYQNLRAVVEAGLPPGTYDLLLEGPGQRLARLDDAFVVSETQADRLRLSSANITATVNDVVPFEIELLDPFGERVEADLSVEIRLTDTTLDLNATIGQGLENQVVTAEDGAYLVTGGLGADGHARIPLQVHRPATVNVLVAPLDSESTVRDDAFDQAWLPGGERAVRIQLPSTPYTTTAGDEVPLTVRLEDQFGNLVTDSPTLVSLRTACGDATTLLPALVGEVQTTIRPTAATDLTNPCEAQWIEVANGPPGRSGDFVVQADAPDRFRVDVPIPRIRAGSDVFTIVTTLDAFGNRTQVPDDIVLQDSLGGLGPTSCSPSVTGDRNCFATSVRAGYGVTVTASSGAVIGRSLSYDVLPSTEVERIEGEATTDAVAGIPAEVAVTLFDPFDNPLLASDAPDELVVAPDGPDESCERAGVMADGRLRFLCGFRVARPDAHVTISTGAIEGTSEAFPVVNGAAASATLTSPTRVGAGTPFDVRVHVQDAFGNPYLVGPAPSLTDAGGDLAPLPLRDADSTLQATLVTAGVNTLRVDLAGANLGEEPVIVDASVPETLDVDVLAPWAFVDEPVDVRLVARDAYGNRSPVDSSYRLEGQDRILQGSLVNGSVTVPWSWPATDAGAVVVGSTAELSGSSTPTTVVQRCAAGPTATPAFAGAPAGRACTAPDGGPVAVTVSLGGSTPGDQPIQGYAARTSVGATTSGVPSFPVEVVGPGRSDVDLLVWDSAFCGDETTAAVWSGPDDGSPVGELDLLGPDEVTLGSMGTYLLDGAVDCTGDPASGASVQLLTTRGDLIGPTLTGAGLQTSLDVAGNASFVVDTSGWPSGGEGALYARVSSGGAAGSRSITVVGDDQNPRVWSQSPHGETMESLSAIQLTFDEPLLPATVTPGAFSLTGPATVGIDGVTLDGSVVTLQTDTLIDTSLGIWTLEATNVLRDLAGNRLDGAETGSPSSWLGRFGNIPPAVDPVSCTPAQTLFRPDGDPGAGVESDVIELFVTSASTPARWVTSVSDPSGQLVQREHRIPVASIETLAWDGRDASGALVPDGVYTFAVEADDGFGNLAGGCSVQVTVDKLRSAE